MRRQGWALCLGMLAGGSAMAQSPTTGERNPPPPELPGKVIAQAPAPRPSSASHPVVVSRPRGQKPTEPTDTVPVSEGPLDSATTAPLEGSTPAAPPTTELPPVPGMLPPPAACPTKSVTKDCGAGHGNIFDWLTFRTHARQSGHRKPAYTPPLQAWFPCEVNPRWRSDCTGLLPRPTCATPAPGCASLLMPGVVPAPVTSPDGTVPPTPPAVCSPPECPDKEALTSFEKVGDGLGFAPGGAPMANPTRQAQPSKWKPR